MSKAKEVDALKESLCLTYDSLVYYKIMHWVMKAGSDEVSGVGKIVKDGSRLRVVDACMLPQSNSAGGTDIEPEDLGKAEFLLKDTEGDLRFWWHSHVQMNCFWSMTDITTLELLGRHGWYVATVFNQKWERRSAVYLGNGIDLFIDEIPTTHQFKMPEAVAAPWDAEFDRNVKVAKFTPHHWFGAKKEVAAFKAWRANLTKRERKLIQNGQGDDEIIAIYDTENYGRVLWTQRDEDQYCKFLTHRENPAVLVEVRRHELIRDITEIRFVNDEISNQLVSLGSETWCHNDAVTAFAKKMKARSNGKALVVVEPKGILTLADLEAQNIETEKEMRRMYPDWEKKSEWEKDAFRDLWKSGEFPWGSEGGDTPNGIYGVD